MKIRLFALSVMCAPVLFGQVQQKPTLEEIRSGFHNWLEAQEEPVYPEDHIENEMDGLETRFMRWYWLMHTRTLADGGLPDPGIAARE